jgi:cytochrome c-type biogenesis protein CcmF
MIEQIGNASLSAAVVVAAGAIFATVAGLRARSSRWLAAANWSVAAIAILLTIASAALLAAIVGNEFRFEYVASYSERALPIGYKIAAFWAGQEGSLLLWGWLVGMTSLIALIGFRRWHGTDRAVAVAVLASVCGFFAALILFAANPFDLIGGGIVPSDGRGLNPQLQDPGMIAHPPLLFMGYAGFTVPFAVFIGVLAAGRGDNQWLGLIRRWLLVSWVFLTAGIVLGAWWAYVELGWGGYWAWDPVENASLLPWLTATALIHSISVQKSRGMFKWWNASLISTTFILCIFGTYLTRSGVIDSVHAFGKSSIGNFFLVFMALAAAASLGLMIWRRAMLKPEHELDGFVSREGAFLAANVLLVLMMLITLIGTVFPLLSSPFLENPITVKAPFYNAVIMPLALTLVFIMAHGPVLAFGKSAASRIARDMVLPGIAAIVVTISIIIFMRTAWTDPIKTLFSADQYTPEMERALFSAFVSAVVAFIATLGTFAVIVGFARAVGARRKNTGENWVLASIRLIDLDHRRYGGQLAHLGLMLVVIGVTGSSLYHNEKIFRLHPGESARIGDSTLTFESLDERYEANYGAVIARVTLTGRNGISRTLEPQRRFYNGWRDQPNSEVAIASSWRQDLYLSLAGWEREGEITAIAAMVNPLVVWIWFGGIAAIGGGVLCILPRLIPIPHRVAREITPGQPGSSGPGEQSLIDSPSTGMA